MNSSPSFYDKVYYNTLHFKKKKGAAHDVGIELEGVIPSAGEIRLLGNRNQQCSYYQIGSVFFLFPVYRRRALPHADAEREVGQLPRL